MNPIENEAAVRALELILGPHNLRRGHVPPVGGSKGGKPEIVLETYHHGPNGEMHVSHPSGKMPQHNPETKSA